jgi:hypothetical protein
MMGGPLLGRICILHVLNRVRPLQRYARSLGWCPFTWITTHRARRCGPQSRPTTVKCALWLLAQQLGWLNTCASLQAAAEVQLDGHAPALEFLHMGHAFLRVPGGAEHGSCHAHLVVPEAC